MSGSSVLRVGARLVASVILAGVFYTAWMAAFILLSGSDRRVVRAGLWLTAPLVTAAGFAVGSMVVPRNEGARPPRFLRAFVWPLVGCAAGAAVVFPFGPMLIVFGMFCAGTAAVAAREVIFMGRHLPRAGEWRRLKRNQGGGLEPRG